MTDDSGGKTYHTIKIRLDRIIRRYYDNTTDRSLPFLAGVITTTHTLIMQVSMFLNAYFIHLCETDKELPNISGKFLKRLFKVLMIKPKAGRKSIRTTKVDQESIVNFYNEHYTDVGYTLIDCTGLSHLLGDYITTNIITEIENNIKMNFTKYVDKFVRSTFYPKREKGKLYDKAVIKELNVVAKQARKDCKKICSDLLKNPSQYTSDSKYHKWIKEERPKIFPVTNGYTTELKKNPQKFIKHMWYMNKKIGENEWKKYTILPLHTSYILSHVRLTTNILIDISRLANKNKYAGNVAKYRDKVWNLFFNMKHKVFTQSKWAFSYKMTTNGYDVSLLFQNKESIKTDEETGKRMKEGLIARNAADKAANLTAEERVKFTENKHTIKKEKADKKINENEAFNKECQRIHRLIIAYKKKKLNYILNECKQDKVDYGSLTLAQQKMYSYKYKITLDKIITTNAKLLMSRDCLVRKRSKTTNDVSMINKIDTLLRKKKDQLSVLPTDILTAVSKHIINKRNIYMRKNNITDMVIGIQSLAYTYLTDFEAYYFYRMRNFLHSDGFDLLSHIKTYQNDVFRVVIQQNRKKKCMSNGQFNYFNHLEGDERTRFLNGKKLYIDPGKNSLLTIMDDDGNIMRYTSGEREVTTKRKKYQRKMNKLKKATKILELEKSLSTCDSKATSLVEFKKYVTQKNTLAPKLFKLYNHKLFKQLRWYSYMNNRRADSGIINKICEKFGSGKKVKVNENGKLDENLMLVYGDWSDCGRGNLKGNTPSKGVSLKRTIAQSLNVYSIDEYNTSRIHNKTKEKCGHMKTFLPRKGDYSRKSGYARCSVHTILTYKMLKDGKIEHHNAKNPKIPLLGNINRDNNAVRNMKRIVDAWNNGDKRPMELSRPKTNNPS